MTATQRGLDGAVCNILSVTGESLIGVGVYTAWTAGTGLVPLTAGALTLLAQGALCSETDIGPASGTSSIDGCRAVANGYAFLEVKYDGIDFTPITFTGMTRICSIDNMPSDPVFFNGSWSYLGTFTGRPLNDPEGGCTNTINSHVQLGVSEEIAKTAVFRLSVVEGICSDAETPGPPMPVVPDYEYTDPETGCTLNYKFEGMVELSEGGEVSPVFLVSGGDYQAVRNGEKVGGCNVYNYIAYKRDKLGPEVPIYGEPPGGGGPGQPPFPPPNGDDPFWLDAIKTALGLFIVDQLLALFNAGGGPDLLPAAQYQLVAPCNKNAEGEPETLTAFLPEQSVNARLLDMQVEQLAFIQQQLSWKTPICRDHPVLLGDWVTVRFESIENSPQGTRPLRKLFRYRSQSALDLGQIAAYWENFTWNAGPVCVQHKNASWGTPQCWAANVDEGKRVIRFAGLEAGIDPDAVGEWVISGSSDPRFGMPGTMQVAKVEGLEWVTSRQGPSGLPLLTVDP